MNTNEETDRPFYAIDDPEHPAPRVDIAQVMEELSKTPLSAKRRGQLLALGVPALPPDATEKDALTARFWKHANPRGKNECWLWSGEKNKKGYGVICAGRKRVIRAHRLAFFLAHGHAPKDLACHHCDTPGCVNAAHLFDGTVGDNTRDAYGKNRMFPLAQKMKASPLRGSKVGNAILNEDQVREIRSSRESATAMSTKFGVNRNTIYNIRAGYKWKHVKP